MFTGIIEKIGKKVPVLADLKPSGKYTMSELINIGGVAPLMKMLLRENLLHGDCLTVTGKSIKENLSNIPITKNENIIKPFSDPIKSTGHIQILYGNIATKGSVAKITGKEGEIFKGKARVYNNEFDAIRGIKNTYTPGILATGFNPQRKTIFTAILRNSFLVGKSIAKNLLKV